MSKNVQLPSELTFHQNRLSKDILFILSQGIGNKFTASGSKHLGRFLWALVEDPIYQAEEEVFYLVSKISVMIGHYDLAIKCLDENILGSVVWASVGLFEIGEIDKAINNLKLVIKKETTDIPVLVEAVTWLVVFKTMIGQIEDFQEYSELLEKTFESNRYALIPEQIAQLKDFTIALTKIDTESSIVSIKKIHNFIKERKKAEDSYWPIIAHYFLAEESIESSDYFSAEEHYQKIASLTNVFSNEIFALLSNIGLSHILYFKNKLKEANICISKTIQNIKGRSQYLLAKAYLIRGYILSRLNYLDEAINCFSTSHDLAKIFEDTNLMLNSFFGLAYVYQIKEEDEKSKRLYEQAYDLVETITNKKQFVNALSRVAQMDLYEGKIDVALKHYDKIEVLSEEILYQKGKTDALLHKAIINVQNDVNIPLQIEIFQACQILYEEINDFRSSANCNILIANAFIKLGEIEKTEEYLEKAKNHYLEVVDSLKIAEIKELQAEFDILQGKFESALEKLRSSYSRYSDTFDKKGRIRSLRKISDVLALKGDFIESFLRYERIDKNHSTDCTLNERLIVRANAARVSSCVENYEKAVKYYDNVLLEVKEHNKDRLYIDILIEKTYVLLQMRSLVAAERNIQEIKDKIKEINSSRKSCVQFLETLTRINKGEDIHHTELEKGLNTAMRENNKFSSLAFITLVLKSFLKQIKIEPTNEDFSNNFLSFLQFFKGFCIKNKIHYLHGFVYLIEITSACIYEDKLDLGSLISQASDFYTITGIEDLQHQSIYLQYNISEWKGIPDLKLKSILKIQKVIETPYEMLESLFERVFALLFMEKIKDAQSQILNPR